MPRATRRKVLAPIDENVVGKDTSTADVLKLIESIETQVEERVSEIIAATEDAVTSLKNNLRTKLVRLPKSTRSMSMKEFEDKFVDDLKSSALEDVRRRFEERAAAVDKVIEESDTHSGKKRGTKRVKVEPDGTAGSFNGIPLQTPMPFAGKAMPMPVTMLVQQGKRGGKTKASQEPRAAVVTTKDGKQWALGANGLAGIPESHRREVSDLLSSQFAFLASALGKQS